MSNEFADSPRTAAVEPGTSSTAREGAATTDRLALLVVTGDACRTHVLPAAGVVTIGRAADNDVAIDESSVSRHHVQLRLDRPMQITDLETANGTWLRDVRLPPQVPTPISFNEAIRLGHTTVVVQRWASAARSRELRRHEYFTARLDEECARAERRRSSFLIAHLAVTSAGSKVDALLLRTSRETDVLASYGPGEYHLLLVEASAVEAQAAVRRFETATQAAGVSCQIGLATYPTDGRDASSLIARARARAIGAGEAEVERAPGRSVVVDPHMRTLYALAERVATADISVLLLGETGVGKEIFAEFLHARSPRRDAPFLRLNCAALTETLLESELFGHEKGAFTGATHAKVGLLESAAGGVVFLDEVGELQPSTQVKLLRVLDERRLTPVGGVQSRPIDVRVVSATNRDLDAEIRRGLFRSDLLYRLNAMTIVLPPLRERVEEIVPLATHFGRVFAARMATPAPTWTDDALAALRAYPWPGNVRELRNVVERALVLCDGQHINAAALSGLAHRDTTIADGRPRRRSNTHVPAVPFVPTVPTVPPAPRGARAVDRAQVEAALHQASGNQTEAARVLGISRRTLINRVEAYGLARPRKGR